MTPNRTILFIVLAGLLIGGGAAKGFGKFYVEPNCPIIGSEQGRFGEMDVRGCGWATFRASK